MNTTKKGQLMDRITYSRCVTLIGVMSTGVIAIGLMCLGIFFVQWTVNNFQEPNKTFDSCEGTVE